MSYAWIIDKDHLQDDGFPEMPSEEGVMGPREAPDWMITELKAAKHVGRVTHDGQEAGIYRFRMSDDDGVLYYSGRMITDEGKSDEACVGPLKDFGTPNAGAVTIKYVGHPEMDADWA